MISDILEQFQVIRGSLAPLRLSRWQMTKMFAAHLNRDYPFVFKSFVVLWVGFVLWVLSVLTSPKRLEKKVKLPVLGGSRTLKHDFLKIIQEGKRLYPDSPYIVNASGLQYIVYPATFFDEIKRLPDTQASAQDFFYKVTYGQYTHIGTETDAMWKTIGVDLARSVPAKVLSKQQDARIAFEQFIGYAPDWKPIKTFDAFMNIVATTNACSFVGREVATGKWSKLVQRLPMTVYIAVLALSWLPRIVRPIFSPLLFFPALKLQKEMRDIIKPVIAADIDEYERAPDKKELLRAKEDGKLPYSAWLLSRYRPGEGTPYQLATDYLVTSFESTVSTAVTLYNIIADLAVRPDLQDELREELEEVLVDGKLPSTNLKELRKMDSVMRESFRLNPFALFSLYRVTRQPFKLSTGPTIPAGTILCVDSHHINTSPSLFPAPESYDPYRFLKKRSEPGAENRYQFVSTGPEDPNWGDGNQACPGRFFANSTIKVCLAHLLLHYDVKLREGEGRAKPTTMPNGSWAPDMNAKVLFKSRD